MVIVAGSPPTNPLYEPAKGLGVDDPPPPPPHPARTKAKVPRKSFLISSRIAGHGFGFGCNDKIRKEFVNRPGRLQQLATIKNR
jgi:hypothetical protein